jgi:hypothetical protein
VSKSVDISPSACILIGFNNIKQVYFFKKNGDSRLNKERNIESNSMINFKNNQIKDIR